MNGNGPARRAGDAAMYPNLPYTEPRVALDDGTGVEVMVRPEALAEFDLAVTADLARLEAEWARFTVIRKVSFSRRASWRKKPK
jgi:hypothetical protein